MVLHDPTVDVDDGPSSTPCAPPACASSTDRCSRIVTGDDGHVAAVELTDGGPIDADAVVVAPRFRVRAEPFESLGLQPTAHPTGLGDHVETDATGADRRAGPATQPAT